MDHFNQGRFWDQVGFMRRQFLQEGGLPFTGVLSEGKKSTPNANGDRQRVAGYTDKDATVQLAAKLERKASTFSQGLQARMKRENSDHLKIILKTFAFIFKVNRTQRSMYTRLVDESKGSSRDVVESKTQPDTAAEGGKFAL